MTVDNIGVLVGKVYELLKDLSPQDITRVLGAVATLFGNDPVPVPGNATHSPRDSLPLPRVETGNLSDPVGYFAAKDPKNKQEELAVAARFREIVRGDQKHSKKDFENIFGEARRNFDAVNFAFDMRNAKKAGLFVKGGKASHMHHLSYFGQNFVDALPGRQKASSANTNSRKKRKAKLKQ